jgi:hypothetical protein
MTTRADFGTRCSFGDTRPDTSLMELEARRVKMRHYAKLALIACIPIGVASFLVEPFDPSANDRFGAMIDVPEQIAAQFRISGINLSPRRAEVTSRFYPVITACVLPTLIAVIAMSWLKQWTAVLVLSLVFVVMAGLLGFPADMMTRLLPFMLVVSATLYAIRDSRSVMKTTAIGLLIFLFPFLSALLPIYRQGEQAGISIPVATLGLANASQRQVESERLTVTSVDGRTSVAVASPEPRYFAEAKIGDETKRLRTAIARIEQITGQQPAANYVGAQLSYFAADPSGTQMFLAKMHGGGADLGALVHRRLVVLKVYAASFTVDQSGVRRHRPIGYWLWLALSWGLAFIAIVCLIIFVLTDIVTTGMTSRMKRIEKLRSKIALRLAPA